MKSRNGKISAISLGNSKHNPFSTGTTVIYGECIKRFCKGQDSNAIPTFDSSGSWMTSLFRTRGNAVSATECADHREGILCGQCKSGYSLTMYNAVSAENQFQV